MEPEREQTFDDKLNSALSTGKRLWFWALVWSGLFIFAKTNAFNLLFLIPLAVLYYMFMMICVGIYGSIIIKQYTVTPEVEEEQQKPTEIKMNNPSEPFAMFNGNPLYEWIELESNNQVLRFEYFAPLRLDVDGHILFRLEEDKRYVVAGGGIYVRPLT